MVKLNTYWSKYASFKTLSYTKSTDKEDSNLKPSRLKTNWQLTDKNYLTKCVHQLKHLSQTCQTWVHDLLFIILLKIKREDRRWFNQVVPLIGSHKSIRYVKFIPNRIIITSQFVSHIKNTGIQNLTIFRSFFKRI